MLDADGNAVFSGDRYNFLQGDTFVTRDTNASGDGHGRWGAEFVGTVSDRRSRPHSISGTFAAGFDGESFLGAFGAHLVEDQVSSTALDYLITTSMAPDAVKEAIATETSCRSCILSRGSVFQASRDTVTDTTATVSLSGGVLGYAWGHADGGFSTQEGSQSVIETGAITNSGSDYQYGDLNDRAAEGA